MTATWVGVSQRVQEMSGNFPVRTMVGGVVTLYIASCINVVGIARSIVCVVFDLLKARCVGVGENIQWTFRICCECMLRGRARDFRFRSLDEVWESAPYVLASMGCAGTAARNFVESNGDTCAFWHPF